MVEADDGTASGTPPLPGAGPVIGPAEQEFYLVTWTELVRLAMCAGASKYEAEDVASETLEEMLPRWASFSNPGRWARKAVVNRVIKLRTRGTRRLERRLVERGVVSAGAIDDPGLTTWEDAQWVDAHLERLPESGNARSCGSSLADSGRRRSPACSVRRQRPSVSPSSAGGKR